MAEYRYLIASHEHTVTTKHYHSIDISTLNEAAKNNIPSNAKVTAIQIHFRGSVSSGDTNFSVGFTNSGSSAPSEKLISGELTTSNASHFKNITSFSSTYPFNITSSYSKIGMYASSGIIMKGYYCSEFTVIYTYEIISHTVTLNPNGGTVSPTAVTYADGSTYGTLPAPTRNGYNFLYWAKEDGTRIYSHTKITSSHTLVAQWQIKTYTVTFKDENGATLKTETVNHGSTVTAPSDPVKADTAQHKYTFDGWYDANGNKWYPNTTITSETVYTARFSSTVQRYTVKWYNEDGSELLETDESVPYGTMPEYNGETPTKAETEGHTFEHIGWSIDVNSSETTDLSAVVESVNYYARFRAISKGYTVIWKNEDGTILETDTLVPFGTQPDYNGATPEKASDVQYNYTFLGWSAKVEDPPLDDSQLPTVTGNITYTAVYTKTLKLYPIKVILFDTEYTSVVEYGSDIVLEAPEVIGYKFTQWNDGNTDNPRTVKVTGEATYQAVYERIPLPIKVNNEQVTGVYIVPTTQTIVYVISGEVPAVVTDGVTVDGWSFEVSNSVPDNSYLLEKLYINETRVY